MQPVILIKSFVVGLFLSLACMCSFAAGEPMDKNAPANSLYQDKQVEENKSIASSSQIDQFLLTNEKIDQLRKNSGAILKRSHTVFKVIIWTEVLTAILIISGLIMKKRKFYFHTGVFKKIFPVIIIQSLFFVSGFLLPTYLFNNNWESFIGNNLILFNDTVFIAISCLLGLNFLLLASLLFPHKSKVRNVAPWFLLASIVSAVAELAVFFIIIQSFFTHIPVGYLAFNITCFLLFSMHCKRVVQKGLLRITNQLVLDQRLKLLRKIFSTRYQQFERLDNGRVYTTLNNDTEAIGNGVLAIITLIGSLIGIAGGLTLLLLISPAGTLAVLVIMAVLGGIYFVLAEDANKVYEQARATESTFMSMLEGLTKGYKELSLQKNKKGAYAREIESVTQKLNEQKNSAFGKYINASVMGEGAIVFVIAAVSLGFPLLFKGINMEVLIAFILLLIYMMEPIGELLEIMPGIGKIKISWKSIKNLINEIPGSTDLAQDPSPLPAPAIKKTMQVSGLRFNYETAAGTGFSVGPISFCAYPGEVIFITGGNGSGKTTLAKLITGLYFSEEGSIKIDEEVIGSNRIGEYYSTVFSDHYLFAKLYNIDLSGREEEIQSYLQLLKLDSKVHIENGAFSTTDLSSGQRKRLALLKCYLEDRPVFLFDEWAADQDPEFKRFFYNDLLQQMKAAGKIVIAITHDDAYFFAADQLINLSEGQTHEKNRQQVMEEFS
jgi:putative ATP-binding cassette transporter